jgi:hypothetical protein
MNNGYTLYPTPAPTPWDMYDRQMSGLHIDGIFFFMLFFWSWFVFFVVVAWNRRAKPRIKANSFKSEDWTMPSNWRN